MNLHIYQVDAFSTVLFKGNPAAVIPLEQWLDDQILQSIANENNLSETAFFVSNGAAFEIRWFTPAAEVALCGHATLAAAHVLYNHLNYNNPVIIFNTRSRGQLKIHKMGQRLVMNFPTDLPTKTTCSSSLVDAIGIQPISCLKGTTDILFIYRQESDVASILPNYNALNLITGVRGVIITAPGNDCDFVSRFFAPAVGVNEDPVTGSAHTVLFPYWAKKLGKTELMAKQISKRGGHIWGRLIDDRVEISGHAVTFFKGSITLS